MSRGFQEFLEEQFAPLGGVSIKSMFGGLGVFRDGVMFGLVADDTLYFRVDEENRTRFEAEGSEAFVYNGKTKQTAMPYWRAPERLFDDSDEFTEWAEDAIAAAGRNQKAKRPKPKRR